MHFTVEHKSPKDMRKKKGGNYFTWEGAAEQVTGMCHSLISDNTLGLFCMFPIESPCSLLEPLASLHSVAVLGFLGPLF